MKSLVIIIMSLFFFTACNTNIDSNIPQQPQVTINSYYKVNDKEEDLASIFFLGYNQEFDEKAVEDVIVKNNIGLKASDIKRTGEVGDEWYLILPKYSDTEITVYNAELTENGELKKTTEAYKTTEPFILKCNVSDIVPSVIISLTANGKTIEFSPFISLKDGTVGDIEGIFTE